jgi:hypothetical protein
VKYLGPTFLLKSSTFCGPGQAPGACAVQHASRPGSPAHSTHSDKPDFVETQCICHKKIQTKYRAAQHFRLRNLSKLTKSRFTKYFSFLSTVFVDNFVENAPTRPLLPWDKVYFALPPSRGTLKLSLFNQALGARSPPTKNRLPVISAAKKIVHKSHSFSACRHEKRARSAGNAPFVVQLHQALRSVRLCA